MTTSDQASQLAAIFTLRQLALIDQIVTTKISEMIKSVGLVCSHCSNNSNSQLPWLPEDSKVPVPTTPLRGFDKQLTIFKHQLSEQTTKLQQFMDNHSCTETLKSCPSTNSVSANLSTDSVSELASVEQRLSDLEYRFKLFESSTEQSSNLNSKSENVDYARLLEEMRANFVTTMSKLQLALKQTISNQQKLESTDCNKRRSSNVKLEKCITALAVQSVCVEVKTEQLQSDVNNLTVLHSVVIDRHEVLRTLVSNIGHEHNELAEFVRQLSQRTASADDVIELKAIVECMARVTGVSEHKAEQLIKQFIGRENVQLEHLKRELRFADNKISELLLATDQMATMNDSVYQNQLPYLKFVTETMQRECEKYRHDLNAMADCLGKRLNNKVAQAVQQSLVDIHEQNNKAQFVLPSTECRDTKPGPSTSTRPSSKILPGMLQPVYDDGRTIKETTAATAALQNETEPKLQDAHTHLKHIAVSSEPPSARMPETDSKYARLERQEQEQLSSLKKPLHVAVKSVSSPELPLEKVAEQLCKQQLTPTTTQQLQNRLDYATMWESLVGPWPEIKCMVVGHESAQTRRLIQAYVTLTGSISTCTPDGKNVDALVADKYGSVEYELRLANCSEAKKLKRIIFCDIIVICFSVVDEVSYEDVRNVWLKQIKKMYPDKPYLLVGTQIDERQTVRPSIRNFQVDYETGLQQSRKIGAVAYFECSDLDVGGVETLFKYAVQHVIGNKTT